MKKHLLIKCNASDVVDNEAVGLIVIFPHGHIYLEDEMFSYPNLNGSCSDIHTKITSFYQELEIDWDKYLNIPDEPMEYDPDGSGERAY
jgi:hypothetical protein